jgi:hypothetical protein
MSETSGLHVQASYSTTDLNKTGGKLLDSALRGAVRITRREQRFVLMREDALAELLDEARGDWPKTLEDLLRDCDIQKLRTLTEGFRDDAPAGTERI